MADLNGVERNGAAPVAINNGHSRKGSMMGDAKKGSLAFGTVDSPNPLLSSSPAAPSVTGQHLADNVKSFGTIEADGTDPNSVKPPSRRTSGLNTPMSPPMQQKKSFDMHAGFKSQAPQQAPLQHQLQQQQPPMQPGMPFYRPAPNRSPNMGNAAPPYTNYRPQMPQQQVRPGMPPARPQFVPQGYPQQYMYTPQNYYPPYGYDQQFMQQQQQYRPPQSPNPPATSPPAIRPGPSTPQRPPQAPSPYMSGGAAAFTPRKAAPISLKRADGTEIDLKSVAAEIAAAKPAPATPEPAAKKLPSLPVVVRLETPEQKAAREKEDAERKRIKELEDKEEAERKERKERQAREAEAKAEADAKEAERKEAEEKDLARKEAEAKEAALKEAEAKADADKKASEEAARRGLALDSQAPSAASTPLASPHLGSASLPPKPSRPAPIDVTPSPIATARPIQDFSAIRYPDNIQPPSPSFNEGIEPGKYRYDRDFLLQFMEQCKERPEGMPQLAEILESDPSTFARRKSGPARGGAPAAARGGMSGGMGSFGMGQQFGGMSTTAGTTSESRFRASSQFGMKRQPSQGGMQGLPPMAASSSRAGGARSQRGQPRRPANAPMVDSNVAPLQVSLNSWVKARPTDNDESSPAFVERKVKSLLNKLTAEKFESISKQILEWANKSSGEQDAMSLKLVIKLVFDKATDEAHWSAMYAKLCRLLHDNVEDSVAAEIDGKMVAGRALVRKTLIGRCQMDFEAGWTEREAAAAAAAAKSSEDKERMAKIEQDKADGKEGEAEMLSDEYYAAQKAKRRGLGLVQLIGEIYKLDMLSRGVIRRCLQKLLPQQDDPNPDEDDIESAVKLLTTIGGQFEAQDTSSMDIIFQLLDNIKDRPLIPSRIRFMIMDLKDIRAEGWKSKKGNTVMTIAEIHQQAAKEQVAAQQKAAAKSRESISRGGSKTGHRRDGPGEWQSVAPAARLPSRPADMSGLGKFSAASGAPSFGPSSVFNKRKGANTPPMSRQASTTNVNMFSALNEAENAAAEPERPKLNLQARTKPMPDEGEAEPEAETEADAEASPSSIGPAAAQAKIDSDMKELWGEKDAGGSRSPDDIVEYFTALPEEHQGTLAVRLVEDVFRIAKFPDAQVVANGLGKALEAGISVDILRRGLDQRIAGLDDDAIDYPFAYKSFALLMRSLKLDDEADTMGDKITVEGNPRITPKDQLKKAFTQLDG